jgi:hypothetical protein
MSYSSLEVGALLRGQVRRYLEKAKFEGELEEWKEIKSFLSSEFLIRGGSKEVHETLDAWVEQVMASQQARRAR